MGQIKKLNKYLIFQEKYGYIPASDSSDIQIIKSRMLQGLYRNKKIENQYCNYISKDECCINFMNNKQICEEAIIELDEIKKRERLTDSNRLMTNLLSSQPFAFNLFIPLKWNNYKLANQTFKNLFPDLNIKEITAIKFEYVPGDDTTSKKSRAITTDNSCFDVFIEYKTINNELNCFCIEMKYTESFSKTNFNNIIGHKKERYIEAIKKYKDLFNEEDSIIYLGSEYNQLFRNQLLTEEVKNKFPKYTSCRQIVLYSKFDNKCQKEINEFPKLLKKRNAFVSLTHEELVNEILKYTDTNETILYKSIYDRYCNYSLVDKYIK